ncbi:MAG: hypothetical protein H8D78_05630 [Chloroflexi bacterium]|nr:hypothetical protein [Chloroflexota bacterium]
MTRVICPQDNCVFWDEGFCGADEISLDPDHLSCITMEDIQDLMLDGEEMDDEWEEEEEMEDDDWEDDDEHFDEDEDEW